MKSAPKAGAPRRTQGFTLLELMIAMTVIAFALFGILSMITQIMTMRDIGREQELAKEWVQQELEKVKAYNFAQLNTNPGTPVGGIYVANAGTTFVGTAQNFSLIQNQPPPTPTSPLVAPPSLLPTATGVVKVDYTNATLYEIVVTLNWKSRKGASGAYVMRSLYSQPGS